MKTTENVTIYGCDFCKKKLLVSHAMQKHEVVCDKNPANSKACFNGCAHLGKKEIFVPIERGYERDADDVKVAVFHCEKYDRLMYPYNIERRKLPERYPDTYDEQNPMPHNCDGFEEHKYF